MLHMPVVLQCMVMALGVAMQSLSAQQRLVLRQVPLQLLKPVLHMYMQAPPRQVATELAYCGQSLPVQQSWSGMQAPLQSCEPGSQVAGVCDRSTPFKSTPARSFLLPDAIDMSSCPASGTGLAHPAAKTSGRK